MIEPIATELRPSSFTIKIFKRLDARNAAAYSEILASNRSTSIILRKIPAANARVVLFWRHATFSLEVQIAFHQTLTTMTSLSCFVCLSVFLLVYIVLSFSVSISVCLVGWSWPNAFVLLL